MNLKEKIIKIKQNIAALFIALKKKETPWHAKMLAGITVGYALSPVDLVPDFIPIIGYLDDIIILPVLIIISMKLIPKKIMKEAIEESKDIWKEGKPKKWYYCIPIVFIWLLISIIIIKRFNIISF